MDHVQENWEKVDIYSKLTSEYYLNKNKFW